MVETKIERTDEQGQSRSLAGLATHQNTGSPGHPHQRIVAMGILGYDRGTENQGRNRLISSSVYAYV